MKNYFRPLPLLLLSMLMLVSCKKESSITYNPEALYGTWICDNVNGKDLLTDLNFVFRLNTDFSATYAHGVTYADNTKDWIEQTDGHYSINADIISIELGAQKWQLAIQSLSATTLTCRIVSYTVDGKKVEDQNEYTLTKATHDFSSNILGYWQGSLSGFEYDLIWNFKKNGQNLIYDFYVYDAVNQRYINSVVNNSYYLTYGHLMVCRYWDDMTPGQLYECWNMKEVTVNSMLWEGIRQNETNTINIRKIEELP